MQARPAQAPQFEVYKQQPIVVRCNRGPDLHTVPLNLAVGSTITRYIDGHICCPNLRGIDMGTMNFIVCNVRLSTLGQIDHCQCTGHEEEFRIGLFRTVHNSRHSSSQSLATT